MKPIARLLTAFAVVNMLGFVGRVGAKEQQVTWEILKSRLAERRKIMESASEPSTIPRYSRFKGQYLRPEYASLYRTFVKINPESGLLEYEGKVIRPFFTVYSQPKAGGGWILNIPDFDFDLLEKDFARMKEANINVQPRFWSWAELLNYDGTWKKAEKQPKGHGLPYFTYNFQIYDYFLDRAQSHGLYVNIEPSFFWGLHPEVIPPEYRGKILLDEDLWDATCEAYSKILRYFSNRTVIVSAMVGEEDLVFDHALDDPLMQQRFQRYLKRTYGTISNLKHTWRQGYNYEDHSKWTRVTVNNREVIWPAYPLVPGRFDSCRSFEDITLPLLDYYRLPEKPEQPILDLPTYQRNLTHDPCWIDFMQMKEEILIERLNELADRLREADPNHILYYCNAHDFNPAWHFLHCFDRGRLHFDVIGVGQHDADCNPGEVPEWATCREYIQNVASYGPYLTTGFPKGFACGEGQGGKEREGVAAYYPWWLADIVGGGGAFFQSYHWNHIAGRTAENPTNYDSKTLDALRDFLKSIQDTQFKFNKNAEVLILRNKHAAYGMSAGYDFANARYLASILCQLHVPFDILPDSDIAPGPFGTAKVNLSKYRFIFVPAQYQLLPARTWQIIQDWIKDPRAGGKRGLCLGYYADQDSYFAPIKPTEVHPAFAELTGTNGYSRRLEFSGSLALRYARFFGDSARGDQLILDLPDQAEIGCFETGNSSAEPLLTIGENGPAVVVRNIVSGNSIFTCGFPLGMAYDPVWGAEKVQEPRNKFNSLFMGMLKTAGIEPSITAPENVTVYVSDNRSCILLKERHGKNTNVTLEINDPSGTIYSGTTASCELEGRVKHQDITIEPYGVRVLKRLAAIQAPGVKWRCKPTPDGGLECVLAATGTVMVTFELEPRTIYSMRENGKLSMVFTTDIHGRQTIAFDLGDGSKAHQISIKPSRR